MTSLATHLRRRFALVAVTIGGLTAAACGGSESNTTPATTTIAPTATSAPATVASTTVAPQTTVADTLPAATTSTNPPDTSVATAQTFPTIAELLSLGRPIVLAHTAGEDEFPASTLFAFGESMKAGVDMLDLNVQLTKDDVLVVHHDDTVDRATNGTGNVADLAYDDLAVLDDAYWFTAECVCTDKPEADYPYRGMRTGAVPPPTGYTAEDFRIPRLRDVITAFPGVPLNLEIKGSGAPAQAAADVLAAEIAEFDIAERVVVTSFDDATVEYFRGLAPDIELSPGLQVSTEFVLAGAPLPNGMRILQLPPEYEGIPVITDELVERAHAAGYLIWVWPNNRELENLAAYRTFLDQGIDGLNINFPAQAVTALAEYLGAFG